MNFLDDRNRRITWPKEICVKAVRRPGHAVEGPARCDKRLPCDLSPKHPLLSDIGTPAPEQVFLKGFQIENRNKTV